MDFFEDLITKKWNFMSHLDLFIDKKWQKVAFCGFGGLTSCRFLFDTGIIGVMEVGFKIREAKEKYHSLLPEYF